MAEIIHNMITIFEKINGILTKELLTIVILFCMVFRQTVLDFILFITKTMLGIKEDEVPNNKLRYFSFYLLTLGALILSIIWINNPVFIEKIIKTFKIITILVVAKTIALALNPDGIVFKRISEKEGGSRGVLLNKFISNILVIGVYFLAMVIIVAELGYNLNGLIAGLGISSALIALSVQDLIKSIISGATIITEKPFKIGDYIEMGTYGGTVEDITLRNTKIRTPDNTIMYIPNMKITTECVVNLNGIKNRRLLLDLYIGFDTEIEKIKKVVARIKGMLLNHPKILEKTVKVNFKEIVREGIQIEIEAYLAEPKGIKFIEEKEKINYEIIKILNIEDVKLLYNVTQVKYEKIKVKNEPKKYITEE